VDFFGLASSSRFVISSQWSHKSVDNHKRRAIIKGSGSTNTVVIPQHVSTGQIKRPLYRYRHRYCMIEWPSVVIWGLQFISSACEGVCSNLPKVEFGYAPSLGCSIVHRSQFDYAPSLGCSIVHRSQFDYAPSLGCSIVHRSQLGYAPSTHLQESCTVTPRLLTHVQESYAIPPSSSHTHRSITYGSHISSRQIGHSE